MVNSAQRVDIERRRQEPGFLGLHLVLNTGLVLDSGLVNLVICVVGLELLFDLAESIADAADGLDHFPVGSQLLS